MNWVLAVDLGNGGPKVAAVAESGQILTTAFTTLTAALEARLDVGQKR